MVLKDMCWVFILLVVEEPTGGFLWVAIRSHPLHNSAETRGAGSVTDGSGHYTLYLSANWLAAKPLGSVT